MRVIWKYKLSVGVTNLLLPKGSVVRYIGSQANEVVAWVEVDRNEPDEFVRCFKTIGTGWEDIKPSNTYVGTTQINGFVWHVYETI